MLGDYAWFWGDFFFVVDAKLVFDGVFELFPHPMYTVGYAGYYGAALLTRSYTVLLVSLIAHISQLLFLIWVEEPHMLKIYGSWKESAEVSGKEGEEQVDEISQRALFVSAVPRREVVATLCVAVATLSMLCVGGAGAIWPVVMAVICWRVAHWGACAWLLRGVGKDESNRWMRLCGQRLSGLQAYACWQHVYLVSYVMNHALFFVSALRMGGKVGTSLVKDCSYMLGGGMLVVLAYSALSSMWRELGAFGFYYGDFFVTPRKRGIVESGVYRYVPHPEARLGYLAYYGIAIMKQSWGLGWLALFCHVVHEMFVCFIEVPDMEIKYSRRISRTSLERAVENLPGVGALMKVLSHAASNSRNGMQRIYGLYFAETPEDCTIPKEKLRADAIKRGSKFWKGQVVSRAMNLKHKVENRVGVLDCEKAVSLLESRRVCIRRVS